MVYDAKHITYICDGCYCPCVLTMHKNRIGEDITWMPPVRCVKAELHSHWNIVEHLD